MSKRKDLSHAMQSKRTEEKMSNIEDTKSEEAKSPYPRASLLGLPAELLNPIYRQVLVERFKIAIIACNKPQYPGLVTVCRKTYAESRLIYLEENVFEVYCYNYKVPFPCQRQPTSHWILHPGATRYAVYKGILDWTNLMEWVRLWHEGKVPKALEPYSRIGWLIPILASGVFSIAEDMGQVEWSTMKRHLDKKVKGGLEKGGIAV
ncbi:hypothetical protein AC578_7769 [Pseudocercospora eumusae]|uniref:Uncharacterized protein n=1 Tax=Pseudocercospora eumusae TaxID=321146 RepID=A0A139H0X9_9PEZI|nr:hypothetical protein AC578_7769 [Pseudocercospora eumusae]